MPQVYYTPAEVKLVPLDVTTTAKTVGYIKGAGDEVPEAIEQLGATVEMIEPTTATLESISKYDAIVVGIRAYNNNQGMKRFNPVLMKYAENGGTVVVQYTTRTSDMVLPDSLIGPYPFKLTRDRVTVEEAPPTFLAQAPAPEHSEQDHRRRLRGLGAGTRPLLRQRLRHQLHPADRMERSRRATAEWRADHLRLRQRALCVHRDQLLPAIAGGGGRSVSAVGEFDKSEEIEDSIHKSQ
ncbi:MAG: hypothetical protein IPL52_12945 [Flavobacteriales bacterium]|nr:hypothetical protein [Flavobacteriales bacterium]